MLTIPGGGGGGGEGMRAHAERFYAERLDVLSVQPRAYVQCSPSQRRVDVGTDLIAGEEKQLVHARVLKVLGKSVIATRFKKVQPVFSAISFLIILRRTILMKPF